MKIVATIRSYNEEQNIEKCCKSYAEFCDLVLVADGGSTDKTVEIASQMPKTEVIEFHTKVECKNGIWRNPDGPHLQFLWDSAIERGADWIISQDCDQRPNKFLKKDARIIMEDTKKDFLLVTQIYLWGESFYFPELSRSGEAGWWQGLWAWRANINLRVIDKMPHFMFSLDGETAIDLNEMPNQTERTKPPYCFLHFGWQSEEKVDKQLEYYNTSGLIPGVRHPLKYGGKLDMISDWMVE